jgi:hypothetical protein
MASNAFLEEVFYLQEMFTTEISKMISSTGRACTNGQTAQSTKEILKMVRVMDNAPIILQMATATLVLSLMANLKAEASLFTGAETRKKENGKMASQSESTSSPSKMAPQKGKNTQMT